MKMSVVAGRAGFCVAVALAALALADPLTEGASNAGFFGPGNFTDHSNADVLPVLMAAVAFFAAHLVMRGLSAGRDSHPRAWLGAWARGLDGKVLARLLPLAFAAQIGALFVTETCEQVVVLGHGLGGTIWLGGPILVSLAIHAAFCALTMLVIARLAQAFARTALKIVRVIMALVALGPRVTGLVLRRSRYAPAHLQRAPLACRIGERAPPFATA
jgi:hypothetical protein